MGSKGIDAVDMLGRIMAIVFLPILIVIGFVLVIVFHDLVLGFAADLGDFGSVLATLLGLALFALFVWYCFRWVRTRGEGLFNLENPRR